MSQALDGNVAAGPLSDVFAGEIDRRGDDVCRLRHRPPRR